MSFPAWEELSTPLHEYVARSLLEIEGKPLIAVLAMHVPYAPLSVFLRAVNRDMSLLWDPGAKGRAYAAAGVVARIDMRGKDRFVQMQHGIDTIASRVVTRPHPNCAAPPPRFFGGVAFEPGSGAVDPWTDFSDGCFALSRWTYSRSIDDDRGILCLTVNGERDRGLASHETLLTEL